MELLKISNQIIEYQKYFESTCCHIPSHKQTRKKSHNMYVSRNDENTLLGIIGYLQGSL
jgi:hypothetical protein